MRKYAYCKPCHAASMRRWRKTHPLSLEQRKKDATRSYANVYEKRGLLRRKPCNVCGDGKSEKHHPDYDRPLHVMWLCRKHHLELHAAERAVSQKQIGTVPRPL